MIVKDFGSIKLTDPHRHKYDSAMAEYLDMLCMVGAHDRSAGNAESPVGWFCQFGKRILRGDSQGFVWVEVWPEEQAARQVFDALEFVEGQWSYDEWGDEDEPRTEDEEMAAMDDAHLFLRYVMDTAENNLIAYDHGTWVAFGRPKAYPG